MNSYPNFKNINYSNMYNNNEIADIKNTTILYNPYNGFIRGNLFKNLYDPYIQDEPYEIKPANNQAELLTNIDALSFAMTDLNLFLDVNPNNQDAIKLFNQYRNEKENIIKEYEKRFGPITIDSDSLNSYPWAWNDMPWPWDN